MNKWLIIAGLLLYWLVVPLGVYLILSGPGMGYQKTIAGVFAGILAFLPLTALPTLLKKARTKNTDPRKTIKLLLRKGSHRQLRLFACAVWRRTVEKSSAGPSSEIQFRLLDEAERYSDGLVTETEIALSRNAPEAKGYAIQFCLSEFHTNDVIVFAHNLWMFSVENSEFSFRSQIERLRDILGNSDHSITLVPTWLTPNVKALAQTIYDNHDFDRLPSLADALKEAGCDNADILSHCQGPGPHVRGCWVVDLVLGKECPVRPSKRTPFGTTGNR